MNNLAAAFRTGLNLAAAQLAGAANDGRAVTRTPCPADDRPGLVYIARRPSLRADRIIAAVGADIASAPKGDSMVTVRAADALASAMTSTGTDPGSRAGRLAVRVVGGTLKAAGFEVIG